MTWIVMTSSAHMPSSCRGNYRNVALVKLTPEYAAEGLMPKMISARAKGIERLSVWGPLNVGKTMRAAYQSQLAWAEAEAERLNAQQEEGGMTRQKAAALAKRLGCTLDYQRTEHAKHVMIYLPEGAEFDGNPGLDVLHHECELDEDIWPGVIADLESIA